MPAKSAMNSLKLLQESWMLCLSTLININEKLVTTFVKMRLDNLSLSLIILYDPYNKNSKKLQEIEKVAG